jgi:hypothetical protein
VRHTDYPATTLAPVKRLWLTHGAKPKFTPSAIGGQKKILGMGNARKLTENSEFRIPSDRGLVDILVTKVHNMDTIMPLGQKASIFKSYTPDRSSRE